MTGGGYSSIQCTFWRGQCASIWGFIQNRNQGLLGLCLGERGQRQMALPVELQRGIGKLEYWSLGHNITRTKTRNFFQVKEGFIPEQEAILRIQPEMLAQLLHPRP